MKQNRVAIYVSVDNKEQGKVNFIKGEAQLIRECCLFEGSTVVAVYEDIVFSDDPMEDRLGLQKMLADSKKNIFDEVIVWESSRLTENIYDLVKISERLKKDNVTLSSMIEPFGFAEIKAAS